MLILNDLSFRYKIPLRATVLVIVTVFLLTTLLVVREQQELQRDLQENAVLLGKTLGQNLINPMLQDDVWRAYELLRTPLLDLDERAKQRLPFAIVLFDREFRVLASSDPARYPILAYPETLPELQSFAPWVRGERQIPASRTLLDEAEEVLGQVSSVQADGVTLGYVLLGYSRAGLRARAVSLVNGAVLYTLALLAVLLPVTWYWGWRMAHPLIALADNMGKVGKTLPSDAELHLETSDDEIGRASKAFRQMLQALREKAVLEQEMILNERLAAIGRLTAGVAHEINNPLGGMLNALDTFNRHGGDAAKVGKTLSLIERGLLQIRDTVSAMLVDVRPSGKPLTRFDFEDVRTLLSAEISKKQVQLAWEVALPDNGLPLPAALVRQVLFNLLLNALQATPAGGKVVVQAVMDAYLLTFSVANQGEPIPAERMTRLFEPFATGRAEGHGLGLWVSYQIVQQLDGRISVTSDAQGTCFSVALPH